MLFSDGILFQIGLGDFFFFFFGEGYPCVGI